MRSDVDGDRWSFLHSLYRLIDIIIIIQHHISFQHRSSQLERLHHQLISCSGLSPDLLIRCIYPQLQKVGFSDRAGRPLLFRSLQGSDDLILDSFSHIMVVHPDQQPPEQGGKEDECISQSQLLHRFHSEGGGSSEVTETDDSQGDV